MASSFTLYINCLYVFIIMLPTIFPSFPYYDIRLQNGKKCGIVSAMSF